MPTNTMPDVVQILATNDEEAALYTMGAEVRGSKVKGATIWTGITPPNSFIELAPGVRMSTPEYFYLRVANTRPREEAIAVAEEITGYYVSHLTSPDLPEWYWESRVEPATTIEKLVEYLMPVVGTVEGQTALKLLNFVEGGHTQP